MTTTERDDKIESPVEIVSGEYGGPTGCNAAFIAHARTALPQALDEIERLTREVDKLTAPISKDGPHKITDQRRWLARQLIDSKLSDAEAYSIVTYHPAIGDSLKAERDEAVGLLRELFVEGPVEILFAGNPIPALDLERRAKAFLSRHKEG